MKRLYLVGLLMIVLCSATAWGQTSRQEKKPEQPLDLETVIATPKQKVAIKALLEVLPATPGGAHELKGAIDEVIGAYRKRFSTVPEKVWEDITVQLVRDFGPDKLADHMAPVYLSRFSEKEIKELTAFFGSPVGKKWFQLLPDLQKATYNAGGALGYFMAEQINARLKELGYPTPAKP